MNIQSRIFHIEEFAYQQRIANEELVVMGDVQLGCILMDMRRRVAICRETFEEPDKRKVGIRGSRGRTIVRAKTPATWWDHAKRDLAILRWAWRRGWVKPIKWKRAEVVVDRGHTDITVNHYRTEVEILDDGKELPRDRSTIERREYGHFPGINESTI